MSNQDDVQRVRNLTLGEIRGLPREEATRINDNMRPNYNLSGPHKKAFQDRCAELGIKFNAS